MEDIGLIQVEKLSTRGINIKSSSVEKKTINKDKLSEYENDGWEFVPSKLKKSVRITRTKKHNVAFEDRTWGLLARMGFELINKDNSFKLEYKHGLTKQIDVFACDSEAIVFVECKSSKKRQRKSFQKDINELIGLQDFKMI